MLYFLLKFIFGNLIHSILCTVSKVPPAKKPRLQIQGGNQLAECPSENRKNYEHDHFHGNATTSKNEVLELDNLSTNSRSQCGAFDEHATNTFSASESTNEVIIISDNTQTQGDDLDVLDATQSKLEDVVILSGTTQSPTVELEARSDKMKALAIQNTNSVQVLDEVFPADYSTLESYMGHIKQHVKPHHFYVPKLWSTFEHHNNDDPVIFFEQPAVYDWTKYGFFALSMNEGWLDDKTIRLYTNIVLQARQNWLYSQPTYTDVGKWHISSSYLFQLMFQTRHADSEKRGVFLLDDVKKCDRKINFHDFKGQLIPINVRDNHWAVLKVSFEEKKITYIDSLARFDKDLARKYMDGYIQYYCEGRSVTALKNTPPIAKEEWHTEILPRVFVTQQNNGHDCGVFCCMFIDLILLGFELKFDPSLATFYRRMMFSRLVALAKNLSSM